MSARHRYLAVSTVLVLLVVALLFKLRDDVRAGEERARTAFARQLEAEDARDVAPGRIRPLVDGLSSSIAEERMRAVRGLGRLEHPDLIATIAARLTDPDLEVRRASAHAVAQAAFRDGAPAAMAALAPRVRDEESAAGLGAIAEHLGRLPYGSADEVDQAERVMIQAWDGILAQRRAPRADGLVGVARGFESLLRLQSRKRAPSTALVGRLRQLAGFGEEGVVDLRRAVEVRRAAMTALLDAKAVDAETAARALQDPDEQVRRLAALAVVSAEPADASLLTRLARDGSPMVRQEVARGLTASMPGACETARALARDGSPHVVLLAIDQLPKACASDAAAAIGLLDDLLAGAADERSTSGWHIRAHALVALAAMDSGRVRERLLTADREQPWQVRMYAARAAQTARHAGALQRLARDGNPNVREAAIVGLHEQGPLDPTSAGLIRSALESDDYQLVRTAAQALEGAPDRPRVLSALSAALGRLGAERKDTSRDPRRAILARIGELGTAADVELVRPSLRDFDAVIADDAARILDGWGRTAPADPQPLARVPLPLYEDVRQWDNARAIVRMAAGGTFTLRLFARDAPTNVARFVRQVREGYFNGLTWHRVVPNFVIQGGSPHANEYAGDARYTRDEISERIHLRGTVGISTRGRDTCDGQLFINLVDNLRLDHNYTIIGEVISGLDVVDRVVEGAVIDRVELLDAR